MFQWHGQHLFCVVGKADAPAASMYMLVLLFSGIDCIEQGLSPLAVTWRKWPGLLLTHTDACQAFFARLSALRMSGAL